jgi:uncharacterized membrane protein YozB (DUF420 family)
MDQQPVKNHKREPLISRSLLIGAALFVIILLGIYLGRLANTPGFLGSYATFIADVNLVAQVTLLIVLIAGLIAIKRKKTPIHRSLQTAVVLLSMILTLFIMAGRFFQLYSSGGTAWILVFHGMLGLTAILLGIYLVLVMNNRLPKRWLTKKWKLIMRVTWLLFLAVVLGGFVIYWRMYIP